MTNTINIMSFTLWPLLLTILCVSLIALIVGIVGILRTPSLKGKIGVLLSIFVLAGCCSAAIILLIRSNKAELQEALYQTAQTGDTAKVKKLVSKGADINGTMYGNSTLLHNAIEAGNFPMFKALVEAGADIGTFPEGSGYGGSTPLQLVLERSHNPWLKRKNFDYDAAVKLLLAHGAKFDFDAKDGQGKNCLQNAAENSQSEILKLMFDNGAEINFEYAGSNVINWAIYKRATIETIDILLEHCPDINVKNSSGNTILHAAVDNNRKDIVLRLIEKGADIMEKNNRGETPIALAKRRQKTFPGTRQEIIDLLEQRIDSSSKQSSDTNNL